MPTTPAAVVCWPAGWVYGHIIATHHAGAAVPVGSKYQAAEDADGDFDRLAPHAFLKFTILEGQLCKS